MIKVGTIVKFDQFYGLRNCASYIDANDKCKTGVVTYVNGKNHWFSVEYGGLRTSFNFSDVGRTVSIVK